MRSISALLLCALCSVGIAADSVSNSDIEKEAKRQQASGITIPLNVPFTSMNICASSPIPPGWILTDDLWSPTTCGNPSHIVYNVLVITQFSTLGVGATLNVCSRAGTPSGWVEVNRFWNPNSCGHPSSIQNNMKTIRRVS